MRGLIFDPFAGISGDMVLGALVDLGLGEDWLHDFTASLALGAINIRTEPADRSGIDCTRVRLELPNESVHRHLADVLEIIDGSGASNDVKNTAAAAFRHLAKAEAEVHGVSPDDIHFHEVGALDAIIDVLCAVAGVAELDVDQCFTRPVGVGRGWIKIAHGRFPLPAPATAKLLDGFSVRETGFEGECTTPTGAAILRALVAGRAPAEFTLLRSGYGAGSRDPEDHPNCLRVLECEVDPDAAGDELYIVQSDVDDMTAEYAAAARDALVAAGARDATIAPITMKKGRPGFRFEALVSIAGLDAVLNELFRATSTIGARYWPVSRPALPREQESIEWRGQTIRRKRVRLPDGTERVKPEYEDIVSAAHATGLTPYEVRQILEKDLSQRRTSG